MQFSFAFVALIAPLVLAAPSAEPQDFQITDYGVQNHANGAAGNKIKRSDFVVNDYGVQSKPADGSLTKRKSNYISSCGKNWTYVNSGSDHKGYNDAVDEFCYHATHSLDGQTTTIGPGQYYSVDISKGLLLSHGNVPALISFEIHNKLDDGSHTIDEDNCKTYLKQMSAQGQKCYGEKNDDTKGGTWQVGDKDISYHALPKEMTG